MSLTYIGHFVCILVLKNGRECFLQSIYNLIVNTSMLIENYEFKI